jgi:hypothetical protein
MICMSRRLPFHFAVLFAAIGITFCTLHTGAQEDSSRHSRKMKVPPPSSRIEISVIRDADGKPVEHAAVIFHPILGDRDNGVMELKTNEDGKAMVDVIPIGDTVRLQIIAKGFQTYGGDFEVDRPEINKEIRLKRPAGQYSIYGKNSKTAKPDNGSGEGKPKDQTAPKQQ